MNNSLVIPADAYRMIDALLDYADLADTSEAVAIHCKDVAARIENGQRAYPGNLITVERFDLDTAHSAVIGVMCDRREAAEALRTQAELAEAAAHRLEELLKAF